MRIPRVSTARRFARACLVAAATAAALLAVAVPAAFAAAPVEQSLPTIEGTLREGKLIAAGTGVWGNSPTSFTYQWVRCRGIGTDCIRLGGQTNSTYALGADDVGSTIVVLVTATNASGSTTANSRPSAVVSANVLPAATAAPVVTGLAEVGSQLTSTTGTWTGGPTVTVHWERCNAAGKSCVSVPGATGITYGVLTADLGSTLVAVAAATNDIGTGVSSSAATAVIMPIHGSLPKDAVALPGGETSVPAATIVLPQRLILSRFLSSPLTIAASTTKVTVSFRVTDTRGYAVSNALVTLLVLPSNHGKVGPPQRTGTDGWVTFTLVPSAGLDRRNGSVVNLFARATKDGDSPIAGVSAARLVQVKVKLTA